MKQPGRGARALSLGVLGTAVLSFSLPGQSAEAPPRAKGAAPISCFTAYEEAQIARRERRLLDARVALQTCSAVACPGAVRADCIEWTEQVTRSLPSIVLNVRAGSHDLSDVRVSVDDQLALTRLTGSALELDPGEHRLRFTCEGWPPVERTVLLNEGVKNRAIDVDCAPAPLVKLAPLALAAHADPGAATGALSVAGRPAPARPPMLSGFDWALGGLGVVALGVSVGAGSWALVQRAELVERCAPFCDSSEADAVHTKLVVADVAAGVALSALVALGVHLAFRSRTSSVDGSAASGSSAGSGASFRAQQSGESP